MEIKVNHQKTFSPSGCVYGKGFKIDRKTYISFMRVMDKEINKLEHIDSFYLKIPFEISEYKNTIYFMNLTQTALFVDWCLRHGDIKINKKRANFESNGYLEVIV